MTPYKNISNHFSFVPDMATAIDTVMKAGSEAVFGIEMQLGEGVSSLALVTSPFIRLGERIELSRLETSDKGFTFFEGYLTKPLFLPIYSGLNGALLDDLMHLNFESRVEIQFLFKRRYDPWNEEAFEMYRSYLEGNDNPFQSKIGRRLQEKMLSVLNKIGSFEGVNGYVDEVDNKLLDEGYQFQLRVAAADPKVKDILEEVFQQYDGHNGLRLYKSKDKNFEELFRNVVMNSATNQILSKAEVLSLLGSTVTEAVEAPVEPSIPRQKAKVSDVIELLPYHATEPVQVRNGLVNELAEALKRVGVIKTARLYGDKIEAGIRLTVIQCDIPKGKNLTDVIKKQKDIQAALGVSTLGVEQGDTPDTVRFTIPNDTHAVISLRELIENPEFVRYSKDHPLAFVVGVDETNNPIYVSLAKLVHLLIAGTTGSGKSVFLNTLIVSLLTTHTPDQLKFIMIDPKQVELQQYSRLPHVERVLTDMDDSMETLYNLVEEMEARYTTFKNANTKNITLYNEKSKKKMPYIVCVIDEYADLKDTHKKVEELIARLGQKARAAGIHLVIATQRPSVDVISGRIKANIPNAISFNLSTGVNYKTVFGVTSPFQLLGKGDGVFKFEGYPKQFQRFQSSMISPDESKEAEVYKNLIKYYSSFKAKPVLAEEAGLEEEEDIVEGEDETLVKLKEIIAQTGETRMRPLREKLFIKTTTLTQLMDQLIEEGWLIKHKSNVKGYEITASEEELSKYR